jgi:hypothetical protein
MTIALSVCLVMGPGAAAARAGAPPNAGAGAQLPPGAIEGALTGLPQAHLVWVPSGAGVADLARAGFSPGLMSAGLGTVSADQTYLDVGAGNRVFDSLYDGGDLPPAPAAASACRAWLREAVARAGSAPDEIEPGLMVERLEKGGVAVVGEGASACPLGIQPTKGGFFGELGEAGIFWDSDASLGEAARFARQAGPHGLVIAIATPTGKTDEPIPIGIAGAGFHGDLTSDTTRTDGYVSSTDVAPTIIEFFGAEVPDQMIGQAIRSEGSVDPAAIEARGARMAVVSSWRGPVIGWALLAWILALALVVLVARPLAPVAVRLIGLAVVYLPVMLLVGAAIEPAQWPETLLVMVGAPLLAAVTLAALRDYRALAVAAGITVGVYALDAILGSPLSALSLLGPNPGLGVRFYGIGNELEALLSVLVVGGIGAALAGFAPRLSPGRCAVVFLVGGLVCAGIFASGEFGADVGAAIDFPIGVAVAALVVTGGRRRWILLVILVPLVVLVLLGLADLLTGANSHFTRSVLDAGGLHSLGDTAQRRLEQTARSFVRPILLVALPIVAIGVLVAVLRRATLASWVREVPAMRAALIGAGVATLVATLANDSGALLLEIGAAYLLVFLGWAWSEGGRSTPTE